MLADRRRAPRGLLPRPLLREFLTTSLVVLAPIVAVAVLGILLLAGDARR